MTRAVRERGKGPFKLLLKKSHKTGVIRAQIWAHEEDIELLIAKLNNNKINN